MISESKNELKAFVFQVEQMRMAQVRLDDLNNGSSSETAEAIPHITEMKRQLEISVDDSVKEFNKNSAARIAPEQVNVDTDFKAALESNLTKWQTELEYIQNEQVEQAIIDAKQGQKSARYEALIKREGDLKNMIHGAHVKMGSVQDRTLVQECLEMCREINSGEGLTEDRLIQIEKLCGYVNQQAEA
jgi:hypothetical protein